jgi:hypothetical protein
LLIDVREDNERAGGMAEGALGVARIAAAGNRRLAPDRNREILTICAAASVRCWLPMPFSTWLRACRLGQRGFRRWQAEGLPVANAALDADAAERYSRHLLLPEVGAAGQIKLGHARVAMIGAGGLGSPAALYLAAAGVGALTLIDDDKVEKSNLQRQVLHADARIGMAKAESARQTLNGLNPRVRIEAREQRLRAATSRN